MKRIGNLGLALVAALALTSILGVASASAGFAAFDGEESVTAVAEGETIENQAENSSGFVIGMGTGFETECYEDGVLNGGGIEPLEKGNDETSGPIAGSSPACEGAGAEYFDANGCKLSFYVEEISGGKGEGTFEIGGCSKGIEILSTDGLGFKCEATLPPQSGLEATVRNVDGGGSTDWVEVEMHATGLEVINEGPWFSCTEETKTNGTWDGNWKVRAYDESAELVDLRALDGERTYYQISTGEKKFESEHYPVEIQGGPNNVTMALGSHSITCSTTLSNAVITEATNTLAGIRADVVNYCETQAGLDVAVEMASCGYEIVNTSLGVACSKEGDEIEIYVLNEAEEVQCYDTIPAQFKSGGPLSFSNNETGILLGLNKAPITFTSEGGFFKCGVTNGEHPGQLTGSVQLFGIY